MALIVPQFGSTFLVRKIVAPDVLYVDLKYRQALALSNAYRGGIVTWVAFWAFYGRGFSADDLAAVSLFGLAYGAVIIVEPLADLAVLAIKKAFTRYAGNQLLYRRLYRTAMAT